MNLDLRRKKVFDFNIHLPMGNEGLDQRHSEDLSMNIDQVVTALSYYQADLKPIIAANYMLFNQHITESPGFTEQFEMLMSGGKISADSCFTLLLDFRHPNVADHLEMAAKAGILGIKFHSYIQKIEQNDFNNIVELSVRAEELGMFICIDTSFGTINLYRYDNLLLATYVAETVKKAPIILLHSGGARVLEAMLIADMQENIYLETSLTIPFYDGASLWQDLAYSYRKLNCDRVLYATDFPYITLDRSFETHKRFFEKYEFTDEELDKILYSNSEKLLQSLRE